MANPNEQLEAALAQFAAQPGVTPEQAAQLRMAVTVDADRLAQLNQQAVAGQLRRFALAMPGDEPNLVGTYDKAAGAVTLPASAFAAGTGADDDLKAVLGVQAMSVDFAHRTWQDGAQQTQVVSQDMVRNLHATLNGSPVLAEQLKAAVAAKHVEHFSLLDSKMAAGAAYDGYTRAEDNRNPKGINLPVAGLQSKTAENPQGKYDAIDMTFVLGHEFQHGFNDAAKDGRRVAFWEAVKIKAQSEAPVHDYTDELRDYLQACREDEAKANLAGWNALLSRERQGSPTGDGKDLMLRTQSDRVLDFISEDAEDKTKAVPKPNLAFNQDGSLALTAEQVDAHALQAAIAQGKTAEEVAQANVAGMGKNYFDRPSHLHAQAGDHPVGMGEHKPVPSSDYVNYYGNWAVEQVLRAEATANVTYQGAKPRITIDMATTGLKEDLLEMEGLDLGASKPSVIYYDSSQTPAVQKRFDHTQDGSVAPDHDHQHVPVAPVAPGAGKSRSPAEQDHPDHGMLERIREGVAGFDREAGKAWDPASECLSRAMLAACKNDGRAPRDPAGTPSLSANALERVDHMAMRPDGRYMAAVQGELNNPAHRMAVVDVQQAIRTPVEVSDTHLERANAQIAQELERARQQELVRSQGNPGPDDPTRGGPSR